MNIGIFTDTYIPQINGVATSTRLLESELIKRGHNVYIFTTSDPNVKECPKNVYRVPSVQAAFSPGNRIALFFSPLLLYKIKKLKLDIVHTQTEFNVGIFGKLVARFFKIPHVHTYHTMYEDYIHYIANGKILSKNFARKYSQVACNMADAVIAPVAKAKQALIGYGVTKPIKIIPTGIDFEPFSRKRYTIEDVVNVKKELGIPLEAPVLVSVGRLAKEKSLDVILRKMPLIIKRIPDLKFVIVGPGPMRGKLESLSKGLGLEKSVVFAGARPWLEIGKYYQLGDAFICASTSETQGLTYVESMAAKVPVIAKKDKSVEGIIIDKKTGYFFDSDEKIPNLVERVMFNAEERQKIAENAYENIKHMSAEQFGISVELLYNHVIKTKNIKKGKKNREKTSKYTKIGEV